MTAAQIDKLLALLETPAIQALIMKLLDNPELLKALLAPFLKAKP